MSLVCSLLSLVSSLWWSLIVVDNPATHHCHHRPDVLDLPCRHGEVIAVEYQQIGVLAGGEVELEAPGPVAVMLQRAFLQPGEARTGDTQKLTRGDVAEYYIGRWQRVKRFDLNAGDDFSSQVAQIGGERVHDLL